MTQSCWQGKARERAFRLCRPAGGGLCGPNKGAPSSATLPAGVPPAPRLLPPTPGLLLPRQHSPPGLGARSPAERAQWRSRLYCRGRREQGGRGASAGRGGGGRAEGQTGVCVGGGWGWPGSLEQQHSPPPSPVREGPCMRPPAPSLALGRAASGSVGRSPTVGLCAGPRCRWPPCSPWAGRSASAGPAAPSQHTAGERAGVSRGSAKHDPPAKSSASPHPLPSPPLRHQPPQKPLGEMGLQWGGGVSCREREVPIPRLQSGLWVPGRVQAAGA